jgi:hypothetical protein
MEHDKEQFRMCQHTDENATEVHEKAIDAEPECHDCGNHFLSCRCNPGEG